MKVGKDIEHAVITLLAMEDTALQGLSSDLLASLTFAEFARLKSGQVFRQVTPRPGRGVRRVQQKRDSSRFVDGAVL